MIYDIRFRFVAELVDRKGKVTVGLDVNHRRQVALAMLEKPFDTIDVGASSMVKIALLVVAGHYDFH